MVTNLEKEFTMTALDTVADFDIPAWAVLALANGPIFGSEQEGGFHTLGDVLVDRTADGVPLQKLWDDQRDLLSAMGFGPFRR